MTLQVEWRQWPKIAWRDTNAKMIASVVLSVVSAFLVFTAGVLLARWLKPAGYGSYALVLSIASIASIPISAGLPTLMMREVARAKAENEWASIKGLINFGFRLVITLSVVALIVLAVFGTISSSHDYRYPNDDVRSSRTRG